MNIKCRMTTFRALIIVCIKQEWRISYLALLVAEHALTFLALEAFLVRSDVIPTGMKRLHSPMQATPPADLVSVQCCRKRRARSSRRRCTPCTCSAPGTHTRQPMGLPAMLLALSEGDCPHYDVWSDWLVARIKLVNITLTPLAPAGCPC